MLLLLLLLLVVLLALFVLLHLVLGLYLGQRAGGGAGVEVLARHPGVAGARGAQQPDRERGEVRGDDDDRTYELYSPSWEDPLQPEASWEASIFLLDIQLAE